MCIVLVLYLYACSNVAFHGDDCVESGSKTMRCHLMVYWLSLLHCYTMKKNICNKLCHKHLMSIFISCPFIANSISYHNYITRLLIDPIAVYVLLIHWFSIPPKIKKYIVPRKFKYILFTPLEASCCQFFSLWNQSYKTQKIDHNELSQYASINKTWQHIGWCSEIKETWYSIIIIVISSWFHQNISLYKQHHYTIITHIC